MHTAKTCRRIVVANLPYNITQAFLDRLFAVTQPLAAAVLLLQAETAARLLDTQTRQPTRRASNVLLEFRAEATKWSELWVNGYKIGLPNQGTSAQPLTSSFSLCLFSFEVPRTAFYPVPGVDGAVVLLRMRQTDERVRVPSASFLKRLVTAGFSQRRKKLCNSLADELGAEAVKASLAAAGLSLEARAEELTLEDWARLARHLHDSLGS